jgi:hypothetical protein
MNPMADTTDVADGVFSYFLRNLVALVVDPFSPRDPEFTRLCGVARLDGQRARVVLNAGIRAVPGVAVEFDLTPQQSTFDVPAAIEFCRRLGAAELSRIARSNRTSDSHGNVVVTANDLGFHEQSFEAPRDIALLSLFSVLVHGGGFPWFEEVFSFNGFMLTASDRFRLYLKKTDTNQTLGVEIPERAPGGTPLTGFTALPQELFALIRKGEIFRLECRDMTDDYCDSVFDLSEWLGVRREA